jgi:hypothetical protein
MFAKFQQNHLLFYGSPIQGHYEKSKVVDKGNIRPVEGRLTITDFHSFRLFFQVSNPIG